MRRPRLARLVATGFTVIVGFQLALAAGAPWGTAAWGGADPGRLSGELRWASAVAAGFWLLAALTALSRGGMATSPVPYGVGRPAMWALTALLVLGTLMNAASTSRWERFGWAPFILALAVLSLRLARSRDPQEGGATRSTDGDLRPLPRWARAHRSSG